MDHAILDAVVEITGQRDFESLENSLVISLADIATVDSIMLLRYSSDGRTDILSVVINLVTETDAAGSPRYNLRTEPPTLEIDPAMASCLENGETVVDDSGSGVNTMLPTICAGSVSGALLLKSPESLDAHLNQLERVVAIFNNYQTLLNESERDSLTGLLNRRTFDTKLDRLLRTQLQNKQILVGSEWMREKRYLGPDSYAWLVIIDIDHFKRVNDNYGHLFGDEVILILSQKMRECFRNSDLLFRFGGEEFVVILEPIPAPMAQTTLDKFREMIANLQFPQIGQVTISIGYSLVTESDYPAQVLEQADQALYYAKEHGRNQVHEFATLVEDGKISETHASGSIELF